MRQNHLELSNESLLVKKIKRIFKPAEADLVLQAISFSKERLNGRALEYFKVAELLLDQGADASIIASAFIIPYLCSASPEFKEIRKPFEQTLPKIFSDYHLLNSLFTKATSRKRTNIKVLLDTIAEDTRKALLVIAYRLVELESDLDNHNRDICEKAKETLELFVPIANRLSLGEVRRRLEDVCFHILDPKNYEELKHKLYPIQAVDDKCLKILKDGIQKLLKENGIQGNIQGRTKSLYGVHRKMIRTGKNLDGIMDRIGLRLILKSVPECYNVLGLLHTHFTPIPGTFDDYIGLPKDNGYQSLHTCVYPVREISHKPIEFQIRTELMHMEAEYGVASHWRYKSESATREHDRLQLGWMKNLVYQHQSEKNSDEFIKLLHRQVYESHLVVFGKAGRIMRLPHNATAGDYLKKLNIDVSKCAAIKVNGKWVDSSQILQDGDSIEIIESDKVNSSIDNDNGLKYMNC